jgi:hypothetical protein
MTDKYHPTQPNQGLKPKRVHFYRDAVWLRLAADRSPLTSGKDRPLKGWPRMPNQPADIAGWNGRGAAVRMGGSTLVARDMDITIEPLRDQILAAAALRWPDFMQRCLRRHSGAVKLMLIGRCPDAQQRYLSTWRYIDPDNPDGEAQRAECHP